MPGIQYQQTLLPSQEYLRFCLHFASESQKSLCTKSLAEIKIQGQEECNNQELGSQIDNNWVSNELLVLCA